MTWGSHQQMLWHWLPPGAVSLLLNLLLLHALSLTLFPRGLVALDSVLSVELEPSPGPARPPRAAAPSPPMPKTPQSVSQPMRTEVPAPTDFTETADARHADTSTSVEPLYRVTRLPAFLRRAEPAYPETERALGRQARVLAEVTLNESGEITDLRIAHSGGPAFDAAAIAALRASRFSPALIHDRAVSVRFQVPFQFKLD